MTTILPQIEEKKVEKDPLTLKIIDETEPLYQHFMKKIVRLFSRVQTVKDKHSRQLVKLNRKFEALNNKIGKPMRDTKHLNVMSQKMKKDMKLTKRSLFWMQIQFAILIAVFASVVMKLY